MLCITIVLNYSLFKIWHFFLLSVIYFTVIIIFFNLNNFFYFFIYSELLWLIMFFFNIMSGSYCNDPRFIIIGFIVLIIAALEIICVAFCLVLKNSFVN